MSSRRYSPKAREFISEEIRHLRHKGYEPERAIAAAIEQARRKGYKVPPRPNPELVLVNPGRRMGTAVYEIKYRHAADGLDYVHKFSEPENVELYVLGPNKVLIFGRYHPIVDQFRR